MVTRLMLRLLGVGEEAKLEEVVDKFGPELLPEYLPALWMLAGRLQKNQALEECTILSELEDCDFTECTKLLNPDDCVIAVMGAADDRAAIDRLKLF